MTQLARLAYVKYQLVTQSTKAPIECSHQHSFTVLIFSMLRHKSVELTFFDKSNIVKVRVCDDDGNMGVRTFHERQHHKVGLNLKIGQ